MQYRTLIASASIALTSAMASAEIVSIDFDSLTPGSAVTDQYEGVTFSLLGDATVAGPIAVTTSRPAYAPAGAIVLRPGVPTDAQDGPWYDIELTFADAVDWFSMLALDADEAVSATAYAGSVVVDSIAYAPGSNYQVRDLQLGTIGGRAFDRVVIDLVNTGPGWAPGPELYDMLSFNTADAPPIARSVPTPGSAAMMILGGLMLYRRKR